MSTTIQTIPILNLAIALVPVIVLIAVLHRWSLDSLHAMYGVLRMLVQLMLIGYLLAFIFEADNGWIIGAVLVVMVTAASWIALGNVPDQRIKLLGYALASIIIAGGLTLFIVTQLILSLATWYSPQYVIPLAGMIFATSMNSISLSVERLTAELGRGVSYEDARGIALNAALIPIINSLFAVGLVSLPGMMTGQILSGISPFIAARYQIMVMCMLFTAAGFSAIFFLLTARTLLTSRH
ncbi:MAG: ABC transporter permease [Gammaproteobacteria bacterium]|nr:ABC transporter permease [Gammaproteobacteria bacterium]